jgi:hypothetical protein
MTETGFFLTLNSLTPRHLISNFFQVQFTVHPSVSESSTSSGLLKKFVISLRNGFVYFETLKRVLYNRTLLSRVHRTCDSQVYGRRSVKEKIFDRQIFLDGR